MEEKTITIQIGNSDDKLSQAEWSGFCEEANNIIKSFGTIHFYSPSPGDKRWQNACWVIQVFKAPSKALKERLIFLRKRYKQSSISWIEGDTEFI